MKIRGCFTTIGDTFARSPAALVQSSHRRRMHEWPGREQLLEGPARGISNELVSCVVYGGCMHDRTGFRRGRVSLKSSANHNIAVVHPSSIAVVHPASSIPPRRSLPLRLLQHRRLLTLAELRYRPVTTLTDRPVSLHCAGCTNA